MPAPSVIRTASNSGTSTSLTISTLLVDGTDTFLVVAAGFGANSSRDITNVTHHGIACTPGWTSTDGAFVIAEGWTKVAPDAGTWDVVVTATGGSGFAMGAGATLFNGVHQTTPMGTPTTGGATNTSNTINVASATAEVVIAGTATDDESGITAGQTQLWKVENVAVDCSFGGHWAAGATSVTMAWTQDISGWASGGVSVRAAVAASSPTFNPNRSKFPKFLLRRA